MLCSHVWSFSGPKIVHKKGTDHPLPPRPSSSITEGAVRMLQSLAMSILDQWSSPRKQESPWVPLTSSSQTEKTQPEAVDKASEDAQSSVNPMRYLFLLGVLPATFGSLFALGYSTIQILVIGAYIVTSYFFIVENNDPSVSDQDVYARIESVLQKVLAEPEDDDEHVQDDTLDLPNQQGLDGLQYFKLLDLLDDKSAAFIKRFDSAMRQMYPDKKKENDRERNTE